TSPLTIACARPSTTAVLPTPGSPIRTGLFLVRPERTCITRSISLPRPMTGSSLESRAAWVRLRPNWSRTRDVEGVPSAGPPAAARPLPWSPGRSGQAVGGPRLGRAAGGGGLFAVVARQQLDDLRADAVEVGAELDQDLRGDAFA